MTIMILSMGIHILLMLTTPLPYSFLILSVSPIFEKDSIAGIKIAYLIPYFNLN